MDKNSKIYFYVKSGGHQTRYALALADGMVKHGFTDIHIVCPTMFNDTHNPDLAVIWGHKRKGIISKQKERNLPYLVMERGYLGDRHDWCSLGFNGLNGNADFCNNHISDSYRWDKHFSHLVEPWKETSGPVLLCGQVSSDASVKHVNIGKWYRDVVEHYNMANVPVIFRKHPLENFYPDFTGLTVGIDKNKNIEDTFSHISKCVTFSSNSGVLSAVKGIPTVSMDKGSMAWDVSSHDLDNSFIPDRQNWFNKLSYCQWLPSEMSDGTAWEHLMEFKNV